MLQCSPIRRNDESQISILYGHAINILADTEVEMKYLEYVVLHIEVVEAGDVPNTRQHRKHPQSH